MVPRGCDNVVLARVAAVVSVGAIFVLTSCCARVCVFDVVSVCAVLQVFLAYNAYKGTKGYSYELIGRYE